MLDQRKGRREIYLPDAGVYCWSIYDIAIFFPRFYTCHCENSKQTARIVVAEREVSPERTYVP